MKFILLSLCIVFGNYDPVLSDSVWRVYDVDMSEVDRTFGSGEEFEELILRKLVAKELVGMKFSIKNQQFSTERDFKVSRQIATIIKITSDTIFLKAKEEEEEIAYQLNAEKDTCTFIYPDKTIYHTKKIK